MDVSKPTRWRNPFEDRGAEAMAWYRRWLRGDQAAVEEARANGCRLRLYGAELVDEARRDLAGRTLACWCPLDQRCHADLLLAVVAGEQP